MNLANKISEVSNNNLDKILEIKKNKHLKLVSSGESLPDLVTSSASLAICATRPVLKRYSTGISNVDKLFDTYINGNLETCLAAKDIILVSGMSGIGKTTFCMTVFCNMYKLKYNVTFFSFDMKDTQTWDNVKTALVGFNGNDNDYLDEVQLQGRKPNVVCCREVVNISRIDAYLTKTPQDCIFIDYFDKLTTEKSANSDKVRYQNVMKELKELVDKHSCAIFLLIQGSEDKSYKGGKPTLMNTYGGKEVRSEADHILAVYRNSKHNEELPSEYRTFTEIIGLKLRSHTKKEYALLKLDNGKMIDTAWYDEKSYNDAIKDKKGKK